MQSPLPNTDLTTMGATAPIVPELVEPYFGLNAASFPDLTLTPEQICLSLYIMQGRIEVLEARFNSLENFIDGN